MRRLKNRRGQSTLEYAVLIAVIVGGLLTMQAYVKRGMQGRLRSAADDIGGQYSPEKVTSSFTTTASSTTTEVLAEGATTSTVSAHSHSRTGSETVEALDQEAWPE